ncbi:MAG: M14-type cytosolic carboxypeptidase [Xanthomonadales bacterium]|nr:M14-type cytosolic carboxypeptidase [Xanthomonadales bacterium]
MHVKAGTCISAAALAAALSACATTEPVEQPWPVPDTHCAYGSVLLDAHFEAGNLGHCTVSNDGVFTLTLFPEDAPPINPSAWYAFRASGRAGDKVNIRLEVEHGYARYWPKISIDGTHWKPLDAGKVSGGGEASKQMEFSFVLEGSHTWVAGQEILNSRWYQAWMQEMEAVQGTESRLLGKSVQGRPVYLAETADKPEFILFIGRQHPPEITGALGMKPFMDTVFSDSDLAIRFRERFKLAVVPLLNPDGVANGHWRHNVDGTDLNRDWGAFAQPETRAVINWVEQQETEGLELVLVLDFHSTWEDLFYTQPAVENPRDYASVWLDASRERNPDFPFRHVQSTDFVQPNSKNYFYNTRGIPAITYEVGDETDREAIHNAAVIFAEEMMRSMLEQ